jgi:mRNA interferase RelE/StbE
MYTLKYRRKARNYPARLPLKTKIAIVKKLHDLCLDPDSTSFDIGTLKGSEGFRLRLGQYRVIYTRDDNNLVIEVISVRPRGDIYKG